MTRSPLHPPFALLVAALAACALVACSGGAGGAPVGPPHTGQGVVSRTSGVAPLAVHFYAGFLDDADAQGRFHAYDYTWDFGDPAAGTWGTTGRSRNGAKGAVAAHVFERAGTYAVTLTIRDGDGVVGTETRSRPTRSPATTRSRRARRSSTPASRCRCSRTCSAILDPSAAGTSGRWSGSRRSSVPAATRGPRGGRLVAG